MKLLIFDIDGTLTSLDGATTRAYVKAFAQRFGRDPITEGFSMHGRTDPLIFREFFLRTGLNGDWRSEYEAFKPLYLEALPRSIQDSPGARVHVGVRELLDALTQRKDDFALALGTGNMEAGGRTKIRHFNLDHFFPVGGFGDVHEERYMILTDAVEASASHYQRHFAPEDTWVIGDTEHDVHGAQKIGVRTLAVATGGKYNVEMLRKAGADKVYEDLSRTSELLELFNR